MRVVEAAELLAAEVDRLLPRARDLAPRTADHLERAVESVLFNAGEGSKTLMAKVAISCFDIARREANEVRIALRRLVARKAFEQKEIWKAYNLATVCISMLGSAMKQLGHLAPSPPDPIAKRPERKTRGPSP